MDHTVTGYISHLSTEKLTEFLRQYTAGELTEDFSHIIPAILAELERRRRQTTETCHK